MDSLVIVRQPTNKKENTEFKLALFYLKMNLLHNLLMTEVLGKLT